VRGNERSRGGGGGRGLSEFFSFMGLCKMLEDWGGFMKFLLNFICFLGWHFFLMNNNLLMKKKSMCTHKVYKRSKHSNGVGNPK
jgi:hypothetical protein